MKAARIHEYGPADVFHLEDVPVPEPGPSDLLVAVHASSVNPVDYKIRQGTQRAVVRRTLPTTLGLDVSGVVEAVGSAVTRFKPGDAVFASPNHRRDGTYAEYVLVDESEAAAKPASLTHAQAASLPLVGLTAWDCVVRAAPVQRGDKVLIQAGSGGVGSIAIQIAKHRGGTVTTTCSSRNVELVESLGADRVVDYTKERFWEVVEPQDIVLDALAGAERKRLRQVTRRGGRLVTINTELPAFSKRFGPYFGVLFAMWKMVGVIVWSLLAYGVRVKPVVRRSSAYNLAELGKLADAGALVPVIDRSYPLAEIAEAHRYIETGRARGKIVIVVREDDGG